MSETKKEEQLPEGAQELKKNGEKHKKIGIGCAVGGLLMVGGAALTAVLGGPIVLICILSGLSFVAVGGEVYSFCKYRSCKKNVENIMKTSKTDKNTEIKQEQSNNKELQKEKEGLEKEKQNLQEGNNKLKNQSNDQQLNINFEPNTTKKTNGLNAGLNGITNIAENKTNAFISDVNSIIKNDIGNNITK